MLAFFAAPLTLLVPPTMVNYPAVAAVQQPAAQQRLVAEAASEYIFPSSMMLAKGITGALVAGTPGGPATLPGWRCARALSG